jgi:hypothetical protein
MSKRTSSSKIYCPDVRYVQTSTSVIWTSAHDCVYPADMFLPSAPPVKNASAWTNSPPPTPLARPASRPCGRAVSAQTRERSRGRELCARGPSSLPPAPCGRSKINKKYFFYFFIFLDSCCLLEKRGKKCSVFGFRSPRSLSSPSEAVRRRRFFRPSSPSHPSKLYSSLGWAISKVPKPFFPFTLRLIDVDGF